MFPGTEVPQSWKDALILSIYKGKGADSDAANYRPISLLNTFYKIYDALLQIRLAAEHVHHLRDTQYGFRAARSTQDPSFILRRAQDLSIKTRLPFCLLFLDWRMAFDKVDHRSMAIALQRLEVHRQYVHIIVEIKLSRSKVSRMTASRLHRTRASDKAALLAFNCLLWLYDIDKRLRTTGVPTNTWFRGNPYMTESTRMTHFSCQLHRLKWKNF